MEQVRALGAATHDALDRVKPLLQARERAGLVRRCHGDLHLGNIVLIEGEASAYLTRIEFDDRIATGDVYYDLAFLLMDLIERGLHVAANIVLNRYLTETHRIHDLDALAALPLFMSVRAAIRAKVTAARHRQKGAEPELANRGTGLCGIRAKIPGAVPSRNWLRSADFLEPENQCLRAHWPQSFRHCRARSCCAVTLSARRCLGSTKPRNSRNEPTRLRPRSGFTRGLAEKARRITAAGYSAIVDAVFALPVERSEIAKSANGAEFHGLFLTASLEARLARIGERARDASDADADVARKQEQFDLGRIVWSKVDASGTPEETLLRAEGMLGLR